MGLHQIEHTLKLVILQPSFLPWLGYLDQYAWCDNFVIYDDCQFDKNGWRNRNRILVRDKPSWLTVPVYTRGKQRPLNSEIEICQQTSWRRKLLAKIAQNYSKTPYFSRYFPSLATIVQEKHERLITLNLATFRWLTESFGLPWKVRLASSLGVSGRRNDKLVEICCKLAATDYLTGDAARSYLDEEAFQNAGLKVHWHNYRHPVYSQHLNKPFVPYLSAIDLLFREGPKSSSFLR